MSKKFRYASVALTLVLVMGIGLASCKKEAEDDIWARGVTNLDSLHLSDTGATATPVLRVDQDGTGAVVEFLAGGTPALVVDADGNTTMSGTVTGGSINQATGLRITQPTAAATATPALAVNSLAAGAKLLEISDASTPVFNILNGGAWNTSGAGTHSSGQTVNNVSVVNVPTAIATGVPGMIVDSLALGNIIEVRDAATPVFAVEDGGNVTGLVLRYATAGQQMVVGTSAGVTETTIAAHGLTTVTFALCTLGEDVDTDAGDPVVCTAGVSANVVTISLWEDDWSAAGTAAIVHWLVVGTP